MPFCVEAGRVDKDGVFHAKLCGARVHLGDERLLAAADVLRQRHGGVIGAAYGCCFKKLFHGHLFVFLEPDLASAHTDRVGRGGNRVGHGALAALDRFQNQQHRHNFGDGSGGQGLVGIFFEQDLPALYVHQDIGFGRHAGGFRGFFACACGGRGVQHKKGAQERRRAAYRRAKRFLHTGSSYTAY